MKAKELIKRYCNGLRRYDPVCGIYFLVRNNEIVYVGQSYRVHARIESHMVNKEFDSAYFFACPERELCEIEMEFIRALKPKYNKAGNIPFIERFRKPTTAGAALARELKKRIAAGKYNKDTVAALSQLDMLAENAG